MLTLGFFDEIGILIVNGVFSVAAGAFKVFVELITLEPLDSSIYSTLIKNFYVI